MALHAIASIFWNRITPGDFWNIERPPGAGPAGGGGQRYIDIPMGNIPLPMMWNFLGVEAAAEGDPWPEGVLEVARIGEPGALHPLTFDDRGGANNRYRIANQNRHSANNNRHPAWTAEFGFPQAPDDVQHREDPRMPDVTNLRVYVVKTTDGQYFAGFVDSEHLPADWPAGMGLEELFDGNFRAVIREFDAPVLPDVDPLVNTIAQAWTSSPNVLLYGPPATGKTYAMHALWEALDHEQFQVLMVDDEHPDRPFVARPPYDFPFDGVVRKTWVTFHQNYSYEQFVLGRIPSPIAGGGFELKPALGVLLDLAVRVDPAIQNQAEPADAAVIFIDEINRGNVSRIFGEFLTFMDADYRVGGAAGQIPVPLSGIQVNGGETEPLQRIDGEQIALPAPWFFPQHVYVVASMNSVDRAVAPLDTALARRFERIDVPPQAEQLRTWLGMPPADQVPQQNEGEEPGEIQEWNASETAFRLFNRLNYEMASLLGPDYEIGHGYYHRVARAAGDFERWKALAVAWDRKILPLLKERFASRTEDLARILRAPRGDAAPANALFRIRVGHGDDGRSQRRPVLELPLLEPLIEADFDRVAFTLRRAAAQL